MPFLLDEDEALKHKLQHMKIYDLNKATPVGREVPVWFRLPNTEQRTVDYPMITIDFINVSYDPTRAHQGKVQIQYIADEVAFNPDGDKTMTEFPLPYILDYMVTSYARDPLHDRQLVSGLLDPTRLPLKFGYLDGLADNTIRRLDVLGFQTADQMEAANKRLFRKIWTIQISTEMLPNKVFAYKSRLVERVHFVPPEVNNHPGMFNITN